MRWLNPTKAPQSGSPKAGIPGDGRPCKEFSIYLRCFHLKTPYQMARGDKRLAQASWSFLKKSKRIKILVSDSVKLTSSPNEAFLASNKKIKVIYVAGERRNPQPCHQYGDF